MCTSNGKHLPTDSTYSYTVTPYGSTVWTMYYPPMPTKRSYCAAICYKNTLIVAGGQTTYIHSAHCLNTIDLMDIHTHIWSKALPLPWPIRSPSLAIHGSILYVTCGWDDSGNKLLKLDMNIIVSTSRPLNSPPKPSKIGDCQIMAWEVLDLPVYSCSCGVLGGQLMVFGGRGGMRGKVSDKVWVLIDEEGEESGCSEGKTGVFPDEFVYDNDRVDELKWREKAVMPGDSVYHCLCVSIGEGIMIIGGLKKGGIPTRQVLTAHNR